MIDRSRPTEPAVTNAITAEKERPGHKLDLLDLLSEAAVEIANLDCPENVVCRRLRAMLKRLDSAETGDRGRKFALSELSMEWLDTQRSRQTG